MQQVPEKAIILMNLGSPETTDTKDVRKYLNEFLMDSRVIDYPSFFRFILVKGIVSPLRAPKSAEAYKKIWWKEGSPLVVLNQQLCDLLSQKSGLPVLSAMRYGNPNPKHAFDEIAKKYPSVSKVQLIPMYPHYTMSSFESAVLYAHKIYNQYNYKYSLSFFDPFYDNAQYINALCESIAPYLSDYDKIIFSYHGLPERHIRKDQENINNKNFPVKKLINVPSINYREQCFAATELVRELLNIPKEKCLTSFQSRLTSAGAEWIKPYTAPLIESLPGQGVKKLIVVCPSFVTDCLETLEEIALQAKASFLAAGGEQFTAVPCLNLQESWINVLNEWVGIN